MNSSIHNILIIMGPTASGKSDLALNLAKETNAVIINADSMQIYRELPIITAQPSPEAQKTASHKLYGYISAAEPYSVGRWVKDAASAINEVSTSNKRPMLVGGTGMYIKSLMHGMAEIPDIEEEIRNDTRALLDNIGNEAFHQQLTTRDPIMGEKLELSDTQRMLRAWEVLEQTGESISSWQQKPPKQFFKPDQFSGIFLNLPREKLQKKIKLRFEQMIHNGALDEAKKLDAMQLPVHHPALKAHGIPELRAYLQGKMSMDEAIEKAQIHTHQYAKRQVTGGAINFQN